MCEQCNTVMINGVYCHETGCPESWRDYQLNCLYCGQEFSPEYKGQKYCTADCMYDDQ